MKHVQTIRALVLAGAVITAGNSTAIAGPYNLFTTIAIPTTAENMQPGGEMTAFDISFADSTGYYYFADRSNAAVDIINGATDKVVAQAGGPGVFTGQQATTSTSGPDGVVVAHIGTNATLFAGNGTSDVVAFNVNNPASPTLLSFSPISTGGTYRSDEMAFSPFTNQLIVANNADTPAFATLINATNGVVQSGKITIPASLGGSLNGGMEQSLWDPNTKTFFVSIPAFSGSSDPGGIAEIDTMGNVIATFHFANFGITSCSPAGLALGASGNLMAGCGTSKTQTVVFNPTANGGAGAVVAELTQVSGSDEIWYDSRTGNFYVTGVNSAGDRVIDVFRDLDYSLLQQIDLTTLGAGDVNAHSVAVDPLNGDIFVPLEGSTSVSSNTLCPKGCVAVFAVPEPSSLPIVAFALLGLVGTSLFVRRSSGHG